jgi:DNA-binding NtrC family response regulator
MTGVVRVLLVDDEALFLESMRKVLKLRGCEVGVAGGGEQALRELRRARYDAVVLDLRMPGLDGIATLEHIRAMDPALPVLLLSGHADMSKAAEAMQKGAADYLLKPAQVDKLCERIRSAIELRAARENAGGGGGGRP